MQAKHCPNMALILSQKVDTIEMLLRPYLPSLKNLRALAGLKGMLGQTWSQIVQNGLDMALTLPQ